MKHGSTAASAYSSYDKESIATIAVLLSLIGVYCYLLLSSTQPHLDALERNFVIKIDSIEQFREFQSGDSLAAVSSNAELENAYGGNSGNDREYEHLYDDFDLKHMQNKGGSIDGGEEGDDFFLKQDALQQQHQVEEQAKPIAPSDSFYCFDGWMLARSEMNYKFLWMHQNLNWMSATASMDTPLHHRAFRVIPVDPLQQQSQQSQQQQLQHPQCAKGGWVLLQEGDSKGFIRMVAPNAADGSPAADAWVVKIEESADAAAARSDYSYHFLLEKAENLEGSGYILNRGVMGFINVMADSEYAVRGHSAGWNRNLPAQREYGALVKYEFINASLVDAAVQHEAEEEREAREQDEKSIQQIKGFKVPVNEKWVISFGLYGSNPKYTTGAIRNVETAKLYFPGWVCRFYVTQDVPQSVLLQLQQLGAEVASIPAGMGYTSGMFWRFMVASDAAVDRYIVRDSDSRMNARDRIAVEDWIESKYPVHIMRDHVNHCIVMNGGMWGGIKGAIPSMKEKIENWSSRDEYMADLNFLEQQVWPDIKDSQIAHDSYCCDRFPNARPFPSRRPVTYQHVGQVFDHLDRPRLNDIDNFIRGVPVPGSCRKHADWIYG